jgi:hypothetical protein
MCPQHSYADEVSPLAEADRFQNPLMAVIKFWHKYLFTLTRAQDAGEKPPTISVQH